MIGIKQHAVDIIPFVISVTKFEIVRSGVKNITIISIVRRFMRRYSPGQSPPSSCENCHLCFGAYCRYIVNMIE